jgi:hypothetical protein
MHTCIFSRSSTSPALVRALATALVVAAGAAAGGCGQSAKPGQTATLAISRDFGTEMLFGPKQTPVTAGLTAMRQLQSNVGVKTSYGGRYVDAIYGNASSAGAGDDWLYYVDGEQSNSGAAAWRVKPGQTIQWDYHQWRDITTPEAIVGAYPRPLSTKGVNLVCAPKGTQPCAAAGKKFPATAVRSGAVKLVIGPWSSIAGIAGVPDLSKPAVDNGAFADFTGKPGALKMQLLGRDGKIAVTAAAGTGLIAAARQGDAITWIVTGTDEVGVGRAVRMLGSTYLANLFAVAVTGENVVAPLPVPKVASP